MKLLFSAILLAMLTNTGAHSDTIVDSYGLIPLPVYVKINEGNFKITTSTKFILGDTKFTGDAEAFNSSLFKIIGYKLKITHGIKELNHINISLSPDLDPDAYRLLIDSTGIFIEAGKDAGAFYALQTILQLLHSGKVKELKLPFVQIADSPRFSYRGMHLDASRHFFPFDAVKKYIDYLALYKMNYFHWHLTDDQGWRIEIKKYPKLVSVGSRRRGTLIGHLGDKPEQYDSISYGGYYSQEEIKDVINYASARHVTIVPEIEMPGHAMAALAAYPELSCTGDTFETGKTWGVYKDVFCPKEETFKFLENVLNEVCELFPGKYIHIGGDECPKDRWKACPHCRQLIQEKSLKDENALQGYFTDRIAAYLKTKNKITVGWDEILEDGLDSSAIVMSWRGYNGGVQAAAKGHDVIMSPSAKCYFDMYQSRYTGGRLAIGGFLPLDQVYAFDPVPDVISIDQSKHILGAQGNVWTEYITDELRLQEMIFPRICALAEILWTPKENLNYNNFCSRLIGHFKMLDFLRIRYSTALYDIYSKVSPYGNSGINVELFTNYPHGQIYYSLNGIDPDSTSTMYTGKIQLQHSAGLKAILYENNRRRGNIFTQMFNINMATGKEVILANQPHVEYSRGGAFSLVNGATGSLPWIPADWLGFGGKDLDATIDLESLQPVKKVVVDVLKDEEGKIFLPKQVEVLVSENGKYFKLCSILDSSAINKMNRQLLLEFTSTQARFVKVIAKNSNSIDWLFVDEIRIH